MRKSKIKISFFYKYLSSKFYLTEIPVENKRTLLLHWFFWRSVAKDTMKIIRTGSCITLLSDFYGNIKYLKSKMKVANKNIKRSPEQNEKIKISGKVIIGDVEYPWDIEVSPRPIEKNKEYLLDDVAEEKLINEIRNLYCSVTK